MAQTKIRVKSEATLVRSPRLTMYRMSRSIIFSVLEGYRLKAPGEENMYIYFANPVLYEKD
jgi:hypothetical protein